MACHGKRPHRHCHGTGQVAGLVGRYCMVTVTGPGGAGKTRLAGEVAGQVAAGCRLALQAGLA